VIGASKVLRLVNGGGGIACARRLNCQTTPVCDGGGEMRKPCARGSTTVHYVVAPNPGVAIVPATELAGATGAVVPSVPNPVRTSRFPFASLICVMGLNGMFVPTPSGLV